MELPFVYEVKNFDRNLFFKELLSLPFEMHNQTQVFFFTQVLRWKFRTGIWECPSRHLLAQS